MKSVIFSVGLLAAAAASAEIVSSAPGGFELRHEVTVAASRAEAWAAAVDDTGSWWSDERTVSGDAAKVSIDARPLACFCEDIGAGGMVVHLTVTFVNPAVILRMTGALGPLGLMGVTGNMVWEFLDADGGTTIRFSYAVGGYHPAGLDTTAPEVDYVMGEALQRLAAYIESGDPETIATD